MSKHLGHAGVRGLRKLGDVVVPGNGVLPPFCATSFSAHVDRMLDYMSEHDRQGLKLLLPLLAYTPAPCIRALLNLAQRHSAAAGPVGTGLRLLNMGLRGLIFTLYYANIDDADGYGRHIFGQMKWDACIKSVLEEDAMFDGRAQETNASAVMARARGAQRSIASWGLKERVRLVSGLREVALRKRQKIIDRIQEETGKARLDALASEIFPLLDHLEFIEKKAVSILRTQKVPTPLALMGKSSQVYYGPLGTVLIISPWNYPFYQALVPITTALVCGNAVVYKPSEYTPLKGLVEEVLAEAGIPAEWVQICYGGGQVGQELIAQRPDKIFFTGSVATGKKIMAQAAGELIPVELELGGKDAMIVFEDANIERAVAGALWGAMTNTGQSCTSVENLYVHEKIYDAFVARLKEKAQQLKLGVDADGGADLGRMVTEAQVQVVKRHLEEAQARRASIHGAEKWDRAGKAIPPIIIEGLDEDALACREETFGPLLPVHKFRDEGEVIDRVCQSDYGLSASVWGADKERNLRVARALKVGNVSINNVMLTEGNHHLPFGGTKMSGFGRYKGRWGLEAFSNIKAVLIDANGPKIEANWYPYTPEKFQLFDAMTANYFGRGLMSLLRFAYYGLKLEALAQKAWKRGG